MELIPSRPGETYFDSSPTEKFKNVYREVTVDIKGTATSGKVATCCSEAVEEAVAVVKSTGRDHGGHGRLPLQTIKVQAGYLATLFIYFYLFIYLVIIFT